MFNNNALKEKHRQIYKLLLQKLAEDGNFDKEDIFILVELSKEWKIDYAAASDTAGITVALAPVLGVKPLKPAPPMPTIPYHGGSEEPICHAEPPKESK